VDLCEGQGGKCLERVRVYPALVFLLFKAALAPRMDLFKVALAPRMDLI
jgi:hypothetical protein